MFQVKHSVILLLVFSLPVLDCRKVSGGGGRGFSGARSQSAGGGRFGGGGGQPHGGFGQPQGGGGGFHPQQPGPGYKPGGGYPPQQGGGGFPHQQPQPNFGGPYGGGGFRGPHGGAGFASSPNSNKARTALLSGLGGALVGGLGTYAILSALRHDQTVPYNGREYGFDQQHYKAKPNEFVCSLPFEELVKPTQSTTTTTTVAPALSDASGTAASTTTPAPANALSQATFADGSRPKHVVWSCKSGTEVCCEGTCCPAPAQNQFNGAYGNGGSSGGGAGIGTVALIIILVLLLLCCCICVAAYKSCWSAFKWIVPSSNNAQSQNQTYSSGDTSYKYGDNQPYPQDSPYNNQPQQQQYPMQPYPQQQYPTYPQQPPAYPVYPEPPKY